MTAPALAFHGVTRWYGQVAGILEVGFTLDPGVTGLLGPNGAGKSTILHLSSGLIRPDLGRVEVFGEAPFRSSRARARLGLLPETEAFPPAVTGWGFLKTCLLLAGVPRRRLGSRAEELLRLVGLWEARRRRVAGYSQGMKQRLKLAQALGHEPDLLLLDEPLTGLDPLARRQVIDLVADFGRKGRSVLVSSHVLHEVESMTPRVLLLFQGRILAEGDVREIRSHLADQPIRVRVAAAEARRLGTVFLGWPAVQGVRVGEGWVEAEAVDPEGFFAGLGRVAAGGEAEIMEVRILDESLEAVFDYLVR